MSVGNPEAAKVKDVSVEHPAIVDAIRNCAKRGYTKERTVELVGMPHDVVDKYFRQEGK